MYIIRYRYHLRRINLYVLSTYYHRRPSMARFVELMKTNSDQERFGFMVFVNILLKQYENIMEQS